MLGFHGKRSERDPPVHEKGAGMNPLLRPNFQPLVAFQFFQQVDKVPLD